MKRTIALAILMFLGAAYSNSAAAADCYRADHDVLTTLPPDAALQPDGYACLDQRRVYTELADGREMVTARAGTRYRAAYVQPRPAARQRDLVAAGMDAAPLRAVTTELAQAQNGATPRR